MQSNLTPFFQILVNNLSGSICILNCKLEVVACNETFKLEVKKRFDLNASIGKTLYEQLPTKRIGVWKELLHVVLSGKRVVKTLRSNDEGTLQFTKAYMSPINDENGNLGILIELKDITAEKNFELNFKAFRTLTDNMPNTDIYLCDADLNIILAGGGEMKKYGVHYTSYVGKSLVDIAIDFNIEVLFPVYERAKKGEAFTFEYWYNNTYYKMEFFPLHNKGALENIIMVAHNVTEFKETNIKLEKINEAKDEILSIVAHDLRNPITGILGAVELIKNDERLIKERLKIIESSSSLALNIISDLLDIGELGQEGFVLETELTEMNEFISELIEINQVVAHSKKITLEFKSAYPHVFAYINRDKFTRVLNNLIINSIKFSHPHHTVTVTLDLSWKDDDILIAVIDKGIGIPVELKDTIFESFTKAGRKGTAGERSVGLGMSIVKRIVNLHKGEVWIESEEGKGTTVYIGLTRYKPD